MRGISPTMEKLFAVALALVLAAGTGAIWEAQSPSESDLENKATETPVVTRVQSALASSPSLIAKMVETRNEAGDDVRFLFGTSELERECDDTAHPTTFFDKYDTGFSLVCIGNAGCQSLWQAMELAALENEGAVKGDRIALMLGTQWFMDDGLTESAFAKRFSDETFSLVMANPKLSAETKREIYDRCVAMGSDPKHLDALADSSLPSRINRAFSDIPGNHDRSDDILSFLNEAATPIDKLPSERAALPSWDDLNAITESEGIASCTNNDLGIYDDYYTNVFLEQDEKNREENAPQCNEWSKKEFGDFKIFLDVCRDLGIRPLIVIQPAMGAYYDNTAYNQESRQLFYDQVRAVVDEAGAELLDLSVYEYDKYYLRDVMHPEWKSWVIVDQKLCEIYGRD